MYIYLFSLQKKKDSYLPESVYNYKERFGEGGMYIKEKTIYERREVIIKNFYYKH